MGFLSKQGFAGRDGVLLCRGRCREFELRFLLPSYDTRLVAVMQTHGVTNILTFNGVHFRRFHGITVIAPNDVVQAWCVRNCLQIISFFVIDVCDKLPLL